MKANLLVDAVPDGGLADVVQNPRPVRDRLRLGPRLERIAEREHVAVGTDARIAEQVPGAADAVAALEDDVALAGALLLQVKAGADAGQSGADDQDVEMFDLSGRFHGLPNAPVMAGHSRPKDGVASARLCPAIHVFAAELDCKDVDARHKAGHDENTLRRPTAAATAVIPGRLRSERTRNLEIPGWRCRAPRNDGDRSQYL